MLKNIMLTAAVAVGATLIGSSAAQAQWGHLGGHGRSSHSSGHATRYGGFHGASGFHGIGGIRVIVPSQHSLHSGHGHRSGYRTPAPVWHDTTHWDYHGPSLQRHGSHYDYVPGHYDLHRSGHWDVGHH